METIQCSCESGNVGIFSCVGAANVGQLRIILYGTINQIVKRAFFSYRLVYQSTHISHYFQALSPHTSPYR